MAQQQDKSPDQYEIEAIPTKAFFVEMLTRDIGLNRAIIDLVDNSIDGARRLRPDAAATLAGLQIVIRANKDEFVIEDNCGGIDVELARHYAFRMGRAKGTPSTPNSVGQFGVGMKRALFKLGNCFVVSSKTVSNSFSMTVDVAKWQDDDAWRFKFDKVETDLDIPVENTGTTIRVTKLHDAVANSFALEKFRIGLAREIEVAQKHYISRGMGIMFNTSALIAEPWTLLRGYELEPAFVHDTYDAYPKPVTVRIYAGLSTSNPREAGWYVICNGRMVVEADQTNLTGWGEAEDTKVLAPKYHNQFARFRGYVFFDCEDAGLLPWNTTKTGVDADSPLFMGTRLKMVSTMRPVIDFLNELDAEREGADPDLPLNTAVNKTSPVPLNSIFRKDAFARPAKGLVLAPPVTTISYKREKDKIDAMKKALGAGSAKEVGEKSFDLYYRSYVED